MANYSIKIDENITEAQIKKLVKEYNKNIQITLDYKNLMKDNFSKLKQLISSNKDKTTKKIIFFPNSCLTQPTENKRNIKRFFKFRYILLVYLKKQKIIIKNKYKFKK